MIFNLTAEPICTIDGRMIPPTPLVDGEVLNPNAIYLLTAASWHSVRQNVVSIPNNFYIALTRNETCLVSYYRPNIHPIAV
jgi:hypothetical protein